MPSLTVPITSNIKMKNSCRKILTRNPLTPPPSKRSIEAELKVKFHLIHSYIYTYIGRGKNLHESFLIFDLYISILKNKFL